MVEDNFRVRPLGFISTTLFVFIDADHPRVFALTKESGYE